MRAATPASLAQAHLYNEWNDVKSVADGYMVWRGRYSGFKSGVALDRWIGAEKKMNVPATLE